MFTISHKSIQKHALVPFLLCDFFAYGGNGEQKNGTVHINGRPAGAHVLQSVVRDGTGMEGSDAGRTRDRPNGAHPPNSGCFLDMAASAKVSSPTEERTGPSDHLLPESVGEVDRLPEGRTRLPRNTK